jgi:hypothetical protein
MRIQPLHRNYPELKIYRSRFPQSIVFQKRKFENSLRVATMAWKQISGTIASLTLNSTCPSTRLALCLCRNSSNALQIPRPTKMANRKTAPY